MQKLCRQPYLTDVISTILLDLQPHNLVQIGYYFSNIYPTDFRTGLNMDKQNGMEISDASGSQSNPNPPVPPSPSRVVLTDDYIFDNQEAIREFVPLRDSCAIWSSKLAVAP
ncbi:hypothetical protein TNCT_523261 [Trichonephila clavata]|uniref:Uncharacterized protein n=1 Tax=Trichonephila clavata TaxID=2740835 RepID=A0A8X6HFJ8_TRICU|nr:hypothetical protein TNCT_523261 [Trichonephila clavata]